MRLQTVLGILVMILSLIHAELCGPQVHEVNTTVDPDSQDNVVLAEIKDTIQRDCYNSCCSMLESDGCNAVVFHHSSKSCLLVRCEGETRCLLIPDSDSATTSIGIQNDGPTTTIEPQPRATTLPTTNTPTMEQQRVTTVKHVSNTQTSLQGSSTSKNSIPTQQTGTVSDKTLTTTQLHPQLSSNQVPDTSTTSTEITTKSLQTTTEYPTTRTRTSTRSTKSTSTTSSRTTTTAVTGSAESSLSTQQSSMFPSTKSSNLPTTVSELVEPSYARLETSVNNTTVENITHDLINSSPTSVTQLPEFPPVNGNESTHATTTSNEGMGNSSQTVEQVNSSLTMNTSTTENPLLLSTTMSHTENNTTSITEMNQRVSSQQPNITTSTSVSGTNNTEFTNTNINTTNSGESIPLITTQSSFVSNISTNETKLTPTSNVSSTNSTENSPAMPVTTEEMPTDISHVTDVTTMAPTQGTTNVTQTTGTSYTSSNSPLNNGFFSSQDEQLPALLIAALSIGIMFLFAVFVLLGKRVFDSWQRRHYTRVDYLINGMYN